MHLGATPNHLPLAANLASLQGVGRRDAKAEPKVLAAAVKEAVPTAVHLHRRKAQLRRQGQGVASSLIFRALSGAGQGGIAM